MRASSSVARLDRVLVRHRPDLVVLEAEVLDAEARLPGLHEVGAPGPEVLHPPRSDSRIVQVDPVVRERLVVVDDERDETHRAVAQDLGGVADLGGHGRLEAENEVAERNARENAVHADVPRPAVDLDRQRVNDLVLVLDRRHSVVELHLDAALLRTARETPPTSGRARDAGTETPRSASSEWNASGATPRAARFETRSP